MAESSLSSPGRKDHWWAIAIGAGLALAPVHNQRLTEWATNSSGETWLFLPAIGYLLLLMGSGLFVLHNQARVRQALREDRVTLLALAVIAVAIGLSGLTQDGLADKVAPAGAALFSMALYVAGRLLGRRLFLPLAVGAAIASVGIIAHHAMYPGVPSGGFVFERNYDIATGYILLGTALIWRRFRWQLAGLAVVALLLSGSAEAVFALSVVAVAVLVRRDWSLKMFPVVGLAVLVLVLQFAFGYAQTTHRLTAWAVTGNSALLPDDRVPGRGSALERRWRSIEDSLRHVPPLGNGYIVTEFQRLPMAHSVPAAIVQQLGWPGVLAALAWLGVSVRCLLRTSWRYVWLLILTLSMFDHYIWTQLGPVWWAVVGASTANIAVPSLAFWRKA